MHAGLKKYKEQGLTNEKASIAPSQTKQMVTGEFRPPDPLTVENRDPNFAYRWIRTDRLTNDGGDRRGWEPVRTGNTSGERGDMRSGLAGQGLDSTVRSNELTLARQEKEKAMARNAYYRRKNDVRMEMMSVKQQRARGVPLEFNMEQTGAGGRLNDKLTEKD